MPCDSTCPIYTTCRRKKSDCISRPRPSAYFKPVKNISDEVYQMGKQEHILRMGIIDYKG
jgi:hypothetical protein